MNVKEITAKSILTKSKLPDADYVVNPYVGCPFACLYCYASFMGRFVGEPIENWGNYVYVKANAVELFAKEIQTLLKKEPLPSIFLSSVTDPYNGYELKYRVTRGILDIIAKEKYGGHVGILTKSPFVARDIDILKNIPRVEVGLTITSTDDRISRFLEVNAPAVSKRLETLKLLKEAGIKTYAFLGPLLPHFLAKGGELEGLIRAISECGVDYVYVEHINLKKYILSRMSETLEKSPPEIQQMYKNAGSLAHRRSIEEIVYPLLKKYNLTLRLGQILEHESVTKWQKQVSKAVFS